MRHRMCLAEMHKFVHLVSFFQPWNNAVVRCAWKRYNQLRCLRHQQHNGQPHKTQEKCTAIQTLNFAIMPCVESAVPLGGTMHTHNGRSRRMKQFHAPCQFFNNGKSLHGWRHRINIAFPSTIGAWRLSKIIKSINLNKFSFASSETIHM